MPSIHCIYHEKSVIAIEFKGQDEMLDEDSRLKRPSPSDILRLIKRGFHNQPNNEFAVFLCGLFAFDFIESFESLPQVEKGQNTCPDFVFYLAETLMVIDHKRNTSRLLTNQFIGDQESENVYFELARQFKIFEDSINQLKQTDLSEQGIIASEKAQDVSSRKSDSQQDEEELVDVNLDDESYQGLVTQLKQNIVEGDVFQVVPSRTFSLACPSPIESYKQLKLANPSPYMFYMQDKDFCLFGASPESALKFTAKTRDVLLYPIAGTRPRGKNQQGEIDLDLDARLEAELKLDKKEVAEHMMLVDLARNDIARISEPGSTHVPKLLAVDRYSQVMHLVSCVQGKLRNDLDALHAYLACMNMGTLTGAPKIKATELLRKVERSRRGSYGGAVGYINGNGDMDTCIVIRAAFVKDGIAHVQAGAGIVFDSVPELEAQETTNKAKAVINAVLAANQNLSAEAI